MASANASIDLSYCTLLAANDGYEMRARSGTDNVLKNTCLFIVARISTRERRRRRIMTRSRKNRNKNKKTKKNKKKEEK